MKRLCKIQKKINKEQPPVMGVNVVLRKNTGNAIHIKMGAVLI